MATLVELGVFAVIGLFGTNAVPHFVRGVTGHRHMSPFGAESSPVVNVVWGSANAAVAGALLWAYRDAVEPATILAAYVAGVALAVVLAAYWSGDDPELPWG